MAQLTRARLTGNTQVRQSDVTATAIEMCSRCDNHGPDVLAQSGVVRRDVRTSIGSASGTAAGFPFKMVVTLVDAATESR